MTMKNPLLSYLIIVVVLACIGGLIFASRTPNAVAVTIIGHTNDAAGMPMVIIQITNRSSSSLVIFWGAQIVTNGSWKWYPPQSQSEGFKLIKPLPGKSSLNFYFPTRAEGPRWRLYVHYTWPRGSLRARIDDFLKKLKLSKQPVAFSPEINK
jgi:hypothetical protein